MAQQQQAKAYENKFFLEWQANFDKTPPERYEIMRLALQDINQQHVLQQQVLVLGENGILKMEGLQMALDYVERKIQERDNCLKSSF